MIPARYDDDDDVYIEIYLRIIISSHNHLSLTIHLVSFLVSPLDVLQCSYRPDEYKFKWLVKSGVSMSRSPLKNIAYEFVFTSPAMPSISFSSCLDDL